MARKNSATYKKNLIEKLQDNEKQKIGLVEGDGSLFYLQGIEQGILIAAKENELKIKAEEYKAV